MCAHSVQTGSLLENLVWQNVSSLGNYQSGMNYSVYENHTVQTGSVQGGVSRPSASPSANKITKDDSVSDERNFQTGFLLGNLIIKNDSQFGSPVTKTAIVSGNQIIAIQDVLGGQIQTNSTFNNQFIQAGVLPFNIIQNNTMENNVALTSASLPCDELMQNVGQASSHVHLMRTGSLSSYSQVMQTGSLPPSSQVIQTGSLPPNSRVMQTGSVSHMPFSSVLVNQMMQTARSDNQLTSVVSVSGIPIMSTGSLLGNHSVQTGTLST